MSRVSSDAGQAPRASNAEAVEGLAAEATAGQEGRNEVLGPLGLSGWGFRHLGHRNSSPDVPCLQTLHYWRRSGASEARNDVRRPRRLQLPWRRRAEKRKASG